MAKDKFALVVIFFIASVRSVVAQRIDDQIGKVKGMEGQITNSYASHSSRPLQYQTETDWDYRVSIVKDLRTGNFEAYFIQNFEEGGQFRSKVIDAIRFPKLRMNEMITGDCRNLKIKKKEWLSHIPTNYLFGIARYNSSKETTREVRFTWQLNWATKQFEKVPASSVECSRMNR
jgi:hypothetical protein